MLESVVGDIACQHSVYDRLLAILLPSVVLQSVRFCYALS